MSTPVSLPIAKLLKEKGWDKPVDSRWFYDTEYFEYKLSIKGATKWTPGEESSYPAPTVDEVKWWLYEKHRIWISVYSIDDSTIFRHCFSNINFNSPTEAYEAAIEYTLNNLL